MKKIGNLIIIFLLITTVGASIYRFTKNQINVFLIDHYPQHTIALIIDEKNTTVNPFNNQISYMYLFKLNGKEYKNNPADSTLKVGNKIEIEYYKYDPGINMPVHFKHQ